MPFTLDDALHRRLWEPNPRQADFAAIPDDVFEAMFGGAAGGGKSDILILLPILKDWIQYPWFKGIIFRRTYKQLEESIIPRTKDYYKHVGGVYNESKHFWTFPSGAQIFLSYMQRDEDARDHDTAEYNYVAFDELTHFSYYQYSFITHSRVRGRIRVVRAATNPGNTGHVWVRDRFVDPAPEGYVRIVDKESRESRIFIPSRVQDNTWLNETDPTYINRLMMLPEAERKAKLDGDWYSYAGQVFSEFREKKYGDEPDNALHVIEPFMIPSWWHKFAAIDWGHEAYTWMGWAAVSPQRRVYIYREYHEKGMYVSDWATTFKTLSLGENLKGVVIDPSAQQKRGDPKTILNQFTEFSGYVPLLADNDRISGKMLLHEYLRWKELPKHEGSFDEAMYQKIYRDSGQYNAEVYKAFFNDSKTWPTPRLQIFNTCSALIKAIPLAKYNIDKGNPEDVAEWNPTEKSPGDDPYDGSRYLLKLVDKWLKDPSLLIKDEHQNELSKALTVYAANGDTTEFYRRMEILESKQKKSNIRSVPSHAGRAYRSSSGRTQRMR